MSEAARRHLLRLQRVRDKTGLSTPHIYRLMAKDPPEFPQSVALGPNSRAWVEEEVDAWIEERVVARDSGADANLRVINKNIGKGRLDYARNSGADAARPAHAEQQVDEGIDQVPSKQRRRQSQQEAVT